MRKFGSSDMFDLTSSKLLILGLVALIVVGPKDLPLLLRTIGKYVGMIRRQANEFRAQFDEAMRDQELANLKAEMEAVKKDLTSTVSTATSAVRDDIDAVSRDIDRELKTHSPQTWIDPIAATAPAPVIAKPLEPDEQAALEDRINAAVNPVVSTPASLPDMNRDQPPSNIAQPIPDIAPAKLDPVEKVGA